jgi:NUMOD3 motif
MNYQHIYDKLVKGAQSRIVTIGYTEKHHIVPRTMGGSDDVSNIVIFTAREHFIAHLLLAKIHGGPMWHAAHMMSNMKRYTNRKYEKVKEEHAKQVSIRHSGKIVSDETRKKLSDSHKGHSWNKGIPKTEEHKQKYKESRLANGGWICPESKKEQQRITMKGNGNHMWGKTHDDEARRIISEANKQKVTCPHCGKTGGIAIMKRWHFGNCKS